MNSKYDTKSNALATGEGTPVARLELRRDIVRIVKIKTSLRAGNPPVGGAGGGGTHS